MIYALAILVGIALTALFWVGSLVMLIKFPKLDTVSDKYPNMALYICTFLSIVLGIGISAGIFTYFGS